MIYRKTVVLRDGKELLLRSAGEKDGEEMLQIFLMTHGETDYLTTYPEENTMTAAEEGQFLKEREESPREVEIAAVLDGRIVGSAGIDAIGNKEKLLHRADFGISILKEYWRLGIGEALTLACIECAKKAGYTQLELEAVADNQKALSLYKKVGFVEYGRNPKAFLSRYCGYQELVYMRLEL